jgi:hypothetical protein
MKRKPNTPRSRVRSALRQLWLRSREHQAALKLAGRKCELCGIKASVAKGKEVKLQVHHRDGVSNWEKVLKLIYDELLVGPEKLQVLCKKCHYQEHHDDAHNTN